MWISLFFEYLPYIKKIMREFMSSCNWRSKFFSLDNQIRWIWCFFHKKRCYSAINFLHGCNFQIIDTFKSKIFNSLKLKIIQYVLRSYISNICMFLWVTKFYCRRTDFTAIWRLVSRTYSGGKIIKVWKYSCFKINYIGNFLKVKNE